MGNNTEQQSLLGWLKGDSQFDDQKVENLFSTAFPAPIQFTSFITTLLTSDLNHEHLGRLFAVYYYKHGLTIDQLNQSLNGVLENLKSALFFHALNEKIRYYNIQRIKQQEKLRDFADDEKLYAAQFIAELNQPEHAYLALFNFYNIHHEHNKLNALFDWIDENIKNKYQLFIAYASLHEVCPELKRTNDNWKKIQAINKEKNSHVKWILPASAWLGGFFVLEIILGMVNHLFYDSSSYMGIGEISDPTFTTFIVPIIFILSGVFGYFMYNLNYSSCKAGTHAYHLERIASKSENFDFERSDAPQKLGTFYYYSTRACMMLLPLFSVLGILSMFELVLFDMLKINNPLEKNSIPAPFFDAVGFLPIIPLFISFVCLAALYYECTHNKQGTYRNTSLLTAGFLISSFMTVMPTVGLEYSALTLVYGALIMICALFFTEAHNNEAQDTLRCSDQTQLEIRNEEAMSSGITLNNAFEAVPVAVIEENEDNGSAKADQSSAASSPKLNGNGVTDFPTKNFVVIVDSPQERKRSNSLPAIRYGLR